MASRLSSKIIIGGSVRDVSETKITSSIFGMDRAVLTLKKKANISKGQTVTIFLGYTKSGLNVEFDGIVHDVGQSSNPYEITCYDNFAGISTEKKNQSFDSKPLITVISQLTGKAVVGDSFTMAKIISFFSVKKSARQCVTELARKYGCLCLYKSKVLHFVKENSFEKDLAPIFEQGKTIVENKLKMGEQMNQSIIVTGYPFVSAGMYPGIKTELLSGFYRINKMETQFSTGGFRRELYLGKKHSSKVLV